MFENPQGQRDSTIDPRIVAIFEAFQHNDIPKTFGWQILVDASADLTPKPGALARPVKYPATGMQGFWRLGV